MSVEPHAVDIDYILPHYTRHKTVQGDTPIECSNAALLAFIAEYPDFPLNSGNMEFLSWCFEEYYK